MYTILECIGVASYHSESVARKKGNERHTGRDTQRIRERERDTDRQTETERDRETERIPSWNSRKTSNDIEPYKNS